MLSIIHPLKNGALFKFLLYDHVKLALSCECEDKISKMFSPKSFQCVPTISFYTVLQLCFKFLHSPNVLHLKFKLYGIEAYVHTWHLEKSLLHYAVMFLTEVATGSSDIPYNNLENLGVQIYGMPAGLQFHSPLLYTQQQLQQILANLEKIVFLKIGTHDQVQLYCLLSIMYVYVHIVLCCVYAYIVM